MPTYQFEAMDATGSEIKDVIDAPTEEEAQATIRQMGYFVTKIAVKIRDCGPNLVIGQLPQWIHAFISHSTISKTTFKIGALRKIGCDRHHSFEPKISNWARSQLR